MSSSSNCTSGFGVAIQGRERALKTTFFFVFPIAFVDSKWFELEELSILFTVQLSLHPEYGRFTCRIWRFYAVCHSWSSDPAVSVSSSWSLQTSQSSTILDLTNRWVGCVGPPNLWKTPGNFRGLVSRDCQIYSTPIVQKTTGSGTALELTTDHGGPTAMDARQRSLTRLRQPGSLSCWLKVIPIVQREFPLLTLTYPGPLILCFHFETVKEVKWLVVLTLIPVQKSPARSLLLEQACNARLSI